MSCQPIIKSYHSPDIDDLKNWVPGDDEPVLLLLQLEIGTADEDGADIFELLVGSPQGLQTLAKSDTNIVSDRGLLVIKSFIWPDIAAHLSSIVASCGGDNWITVSQNLQRYFHWEYEDYMEEVVR